MICILNVIYKRDNVIYILENIEFQQFNLKIGVTIVLRTNMILFIRAFRQNEIELERLARRPTLKLITKKTWSVTAI